MGVTFGTPVVSLPQTPSQPRRYAIKKALEIWFWVDGPEAAAGALAAGKATQARRAFTSSWSSPHGSVMAWLSKSAWWTPAK